MLSDDSLGATKFLSADDELVAGTLDILWPRSLKFKVESLDELSKDCKISVLVRDVR